jgi:hypothetical protein
MLRLCPINLAGANAFVEQLHRHAPPVVGARYTAALALNGEIVGVVIAGRPVSRELDDGWTSEVTRVATDGSRNACSKLYGAAWRAIQAAGYTRAFTYTLDGEGETGRETGASLRASGWELDALLPPRRGWSVPSRHRTDEAYLTAPRCRWRKGSSPAEPPPTFVPERDSLEPDLFALAVTQPPTGEDSKERTER